MRLGRWWCDELYLWRAVLVGNPFQSLCFFGGLPFVLTSALIALRRYLFASMISCYIEGLLCFPRLALAICRGYPVYPNGLGLY